MMKNNIILFVIGIGCIIISSMAFFNSSIIITSELITSLATNIRLDYWYYVPLFGFIIAFIFTIRDYTKCTPRYINVNGICFPRS